MPITVTENAGLRKIEVLIQKVSDRSMLELCESLANALVEELHTVPWGGNIKRGLTHRSSPRKTSTGGWAIGIGSLNILHRQPAPQGTISAFLEWYRGRMEEKRERAAAQARGAKPSKAEKVRAAMRAYRRTTFETIRIQQAREAGRLTREMVRKEEILYEEFVAAEKKLDRLMTAEEYKAYQRRYLRRLKRYI
jgi:hypothetical protein